RARCPGANARLDRADAVDQPFQGVMDRLERVSGAVIDIGLAGPEVGKLLFERVDLDTHYAGIREHFAGDGPRCALGLFDGSGAGLFEVEYHFGNAALDRSETVQPGVGRIEFLRQLEDLALDPLE